MDAVAALTGYRDRDRGRKCSAGVFQLRTGIRIAALSVLQVRAKEVRVTAATRDSGGLPLRGRNVLLADDCEGADFPDGAERMDGDVRASGPVAEVLAQNFFCTVLCREAGVDLYERHFTLLVGGVTSR